MHSSTLDEVYARVTSNRLFVNPSKNLNLLNLWNGSWANGSLNEYCQNGIPDFIVKWVFSFLSCHKQRVKLEEVFFEWVELNGGMPQGTWFGPLCYILLIDSLKLQCAVHKFVDDTTLSDLIARGLPSVMMDYVHDLLLWSEENKININTQKTKENIE